MAKDLKNFLKQRGKNVEQNAGGELPPQRQKQAEDLRRQVEALEGKSENELMERLFSAVQQGKKDGSFSPEALEQFARQVSPMLTPAQQQKLADLKNKLEK
ncbi:MAG: hypothetical protein IJP03_00830 [Christensenellaceae bacterium]|nr:hypothetical protein [Christensenellaceae bacterium]